MNTRLDDRLEMYGLCKARIERAFARQITALRAGQSTGRFTLVNMGSCQCGHVYAEMFTDGSITTEGLERWQDYSGPVSECEVRYGSGPVAQAIWEAANAS